MKTADQYYNEFLKNSEGNNGGIQRHKLAILNMINIILTDHGIDKSQMMINMMPDSIIYPNTDIMKNCPWCSSSHCTGDCIEDSCSLGS